ncbi:hypothetical protein HFV02_14715 [Acidithiobacillus caldus]|uniref:hypothetical protein n=1 Tax=Acidithiobacillus caldus TaxID=33059 RepID=UPI001C07AED4|nr:hypothetical protein [Acidithiobacillus caldus]MBU2803474.1 hypothetical protein [Acidithiobacillus caldus]
MRSNEKWFDQATTWLLCHPRFLGIRAAIFLAYALAVVLFAHQWLVLTLGFFAAYNLGHGIFCLWHNLRGAASISALRGLIWRSCADIAVGASVLVGLFSGAAMSALMLVAGMWFVGAAILEFRWLMHNHRNWEHFFVSALALYLPFAYLLQILFVLGRGSSSVDLFSVNAVAIALAAAAALAVLAATNLPARRQRRPAVRYRLVTQA